MWRQFWQSFSVKVYWYNLAWNFGVAAIYLITGKLGLLLTLPTGYAAAIWPPAGIALAAIILLGNRVLPGIWLGSFLFMLSKYFDDIAAHSIGFFIAGGALSATGAVLQAWVGSFLVRRWLPLPTTLEKVRDISLLLMCAPLSCVIGATMGASILYWQGTIPADHYLFLWFARWVGNSMGILIFTPLILLLCQHNAPISMRRKILVAIPLLVVFKLTLCAFAAISHWENERRQLSFEKQAEMAQAQLESNIDDYRDVLYALEGFYKSSRFIERSQFQSFVQPMFAHHHAILSLKWVPRVLASDRAAYEANGKRTDDISFQITEKNSAGKTIRAGIRKEYFPSHYIAPWSNDKWLAEYDMASEPLRRHALEQARDSGNIIITSRLLLREIMGLQPKEPSIVMLKPVYKGTPQTLGERQESLEGFFTVTVAINTVMEPIRELFAKTDISVTLCQNTEAGKANLIYTTNAQQSCGFDKKGTPDHSVLHWQNNFSVDNQQWRLVFVQSPDYLLAHPSWEAWFVLGVGLIITVILGALLLLISGRSDVVERLVKENIREIETAKKALEESSRLNNAILSSAGYMIIAVNQEGKIIVFNREAERALQYRAVDIKNKLTPAIWHDANEIAERALELSAELGRPIQPGQDVFTIKALMNGSEEREWTFIRKDGSKFPGHLVLRPLREKNGDVVGFLGIVHDVTEQRRQKSALEASEETFRIALEYASIGMALVSLDGRWLRVNTALCRLLGYEAQEFSNMDFQTITHPDDLELDLKYVKQLLAGEIQTYEMEKRYFHKDGSIVWVLLNVSLARQPNGMPRYFISQIRDITEQRKQKIALQLSEATFRMALDSAPTGMAIVSLQGRWMQVNRALCHFLGYSPEELSHTDFQTITHPDDLDKNMEYVRQMIAGEIQTYEMEKRYFHKDGRVIWALLSVSIAREPNGTPKYFISQIQDITERKQLEKLKSEFISTVSHELRTPLTSIRGALGLIAAGSAGDMPDAAQELVSIAYNNSGRLVKIINDILDIEKIESGQLQIHLKPVDSLYILRQALEATAPYAEKFQVRFELQSAPIGSEVMADPDRMMQVMANLLSNAAKFSPVGSTVKVGAAINGQFIRFSVIDNGSGIPEEFQPHIFEKFVQADNSDSRNFEGTGLGLSITRKLVEGMHGTIGFETEVGHGTTFYFDLPAVQNQTVPALISYVNGHSRILVCEDDPDIARLLELMLEQYGFDVDIASTLKEAEQKLGQHHYSAITLDMKMPDGSGADFALAIKNNPAFGNIPVIALSGRSEETRMQMKESAHAVEEWLTKPINSNELLRALQRVITEKFSALPFILHVEDDRDLTQVIAGSLKQQAYVVGAGNLREAHAYLKQRRFDLLIVDPILPDGSGLSLLDNLQATIGYDLPVLILSADEVDHDVRNKVRAALVKSLMSESKITETILSFLSTHPSPKVLL